MKKKGFAGFSNDRGSAPRIVALIDVTREFDNNGTLPSAIYRRAEIAGLRLRQDPNTAAFRRGASGLGK